MKGTSYGFDARVLVEPGLTPIEGGGTVLRPQDIQLRSIPDGSGGRRVGELLERDLEGVTVSNGIGRPFQTFTLELAPGEVIRAGAGARGKGWADILRPYSVITIAMQRTGPAGDPLVTPEAMPVLLGLIDDVVETEDFAGQEPRRYVRVTGRSLPALLSDHRWWFHHYMSTDLPPDLATFFKEPDWARLRREAALRTVGFYAANPEVFEASATPGEAMAAAFQFFVGSEIAEDSFIKFQFFGENAAPLYQRLLFAAVGTLHDANARLTRQHFPNEMPDSTCWEIMSMFSEPPFIELFTDTIDGTSGDRGPFNASCRVIARKPPWAGEITYASGIPSVSFSTGKAPGPGAGESLFDLEITGVEGASPRDGAATIEVGGAQIIARPSSQIGLSGKVYTMYDVRPQSLSAAGDRSGQELLNQEVPPLADEDVNSPSYIGRYGIRALSMTSKYLPMYETDNETGVGFADIRRSALCYAALLRSWNYLNPELRSGSYVLIGSPKIRIGMRLLDTDLGREWYITDVTHRQVLTGAEPSYTTTCTVTRGWDLL